MIRGCAAGTIQLPKHAVQLSCYNPFRVVDHRSNFKSWRLMRITLRLSESRSFTALTAKLQRLNPGIPASFYRGGTSKGVMIHGPDLDVWCKLTPEQKGDISHCEKILRPFFRAAMGSPDEHARQLNGMGGGVSSLSKAVIVEKARGDPQGHDDDDHKVDIDYWFVQIGIKDGELDMAGNCGNLSAAVAPFALDLGLLQADELKIGRSMDDIDGHENIWKESRGVDGQAKEMATHVTIRNMNTGKKIKVELRVVEIDGQLYFRESGKYVLDGVSGTASPITLSFLSPGGAKTGKSFPTGNKIDTLTIDGKEIQATLSDISNPGVFVDGRQIGWDPSCKPDELTASTAIMERLEKIRRAGTSMMGLNPEVPSVPKIVLLYPPGEGDDGINIRCQALSMQQAHKAVPGTLALNLGVISKIEGTVAHKLARKHEAENSVIGHPSGKMEVGAEFEEGEIKGAKLVRTARWLMHGVVNDTPS